MITFCKKNDLFAIFSKSINFRNNFNLYEFSKNQISFVKSKKKNFFIQNKLK